MNDISHGYEQIDLNTRWKQPAQHKLTVKHR